MAQQLMRTQALPELQLRQELRSRFPEVNGATVIKVMKLYNNDTEKCIRALEQESQKSLFAVPVDTNSSAFPTSHNSHSHSRDNGVNRNNNSQQPWTVGNLPGASQTSGGMSRYQEVPVKHETMHVSTVKHTVTPPAVPPKPLPPKPESSGFVHPIMPPLQTRAPLVIDPVNRGDPLPHTAPVRPMDFASFVSSPSRVQTDASSARGTEAGGASGGSPESRRPVRVINVQGYTGGTVTSGPIISPTSAYSNPHFRVVLGDGGGLCSMPTNSAPVAFPAANPYRFSSETYVQPQSRVQETERQGVHSSSIYIDTATNPRKLNNVQETSRDSQSSTHPQQFRPGAQYMDMQGLSSFPAMTTQPLTVSVSSHAIGQGTPEQLQNTVSYAAFTGGYSPAFGNAGLPLNRGNRFTQEGASSSSQTSYQTALASQGMSQLSLSSGSGAVCPPPASSPNVIGVGMTPPFGMSPVLMPKPPRLQQQPSSGSSNSRSNSMDSEQGSGPLSSEPVGDHSPFHPHSTPPMHPHRGMGVMGVGLHGPPAMSSQNSSESSMRDQDLTSVPRPRSGSIQEEAAYMQALLIHQQQRMNKLKEDIEKKRQILGQLRKDVSGSEKSKHVESNFRTSFPTADDISRLCENNRRLQTDIQMYLNEIDMYRNGQMPFSVIDPMSQQNFYNNMPTGPNDLFSRQQIQRSATPPPPPPPRPPPPRHPAQSVQRVNSNDLTTTVPAPAPREMQGGGSGDSEEGEKWACSACTFENHPALEKCEICEMPRLMAGT